MIHYTQDDDGVCCLPLTPGWMDGWDEGSQVFSTLGEHNARTFVCSLSAGVPPLTSSRDESLEGEMTSPGPGLFQVSAL